VTSDRVTGRGITLSPPTLKLVPPLAPPQSSSFSGVNLRRRSFSARGKLQRHADGRWKRDRSYSK